MEKDTLIKNSPDNENKIKLKGVTKKQIQLFKDKKLPILTALGLFGGAGINYCFMSASGRIIETKEDDVDITDDSNSDFNTDSEEVFDFEVPTTIDFSDAVTDDMSFEEAYKAARADVGDSGFYNWRGSTYHTLTKEEWDALSPEEQQEFLDKIQEHSDFDNGEYNKVDDNTEDVVDDTTEKDVVDKKEEEKAEEEKKENEEKEQVEEKEEENEEKEKEEEKEQEQEKEEQKEEKEETEENTVEDDIPEEITLDDIEDLIEDKDYNEGNDGFVTVDDLNISDEDILDGLNDGEATSEDEGIAGGDEYNPEDYESNLPNDDGFDDTDDVEYDNGDIDDLI